MPTYKLFSSFIDGLLCQSRAALVLLAMSVAIASPSSSFGYNVHLSVPFLPQVPPGSWTGANAKVRTNNCGQTSVVMILAMYKQQQPTASDIMAADNWLLKTYRDPVNNYNGSPTDVGKLAALAIGYGGIPASAPASNWTIAQLQSALTNGYPVIVAVWTNMIVGVNQLPHFMVLIGMDDQYVWVNDPGHTAGANVRYPIAQFLPVWANQGSAVVTIHSTIPSSTTGTEITQANVNGSAWSGPVSYDIVDPTGVIIGQAVPGSAANLQPGTYTMVYQSGGPPNSTFTGVSPSASQHISAGQSVDFVLQFASTTSPPTWLSFTEGDPRLPGDGIFVTGTYPFNLSSPVSLGPATEGFTLTVFPAPGQPSFVAAGIVIVQTSNAACSVGFNVLPTGTTTVNNVTGVVVNVEASAIQDAIAALNDLYPQCESAFSDFALSFMFLDGGGPPPSLITTVDAIAIGMGLNNFP